MRKLLPFLLAAAPWARGRIGLDGTFEVANGVLSIQRSGGRVTKLARY